MTCSTNNILAIPYQGQLSCYIVAYMTRLLFRNSASVDYERQFAKPAAKIQHHLAITNRE